MAVRPFISVILVVAGAGCGRYKPEPLQPSLVLQRLQAIKLDDALAESSRSELPEAKSFSPADGLNADEVAVAAIFLNPELKAKRLELGVAAGQIVAAGQWPNPEFDGKLQRDLKKPETAIEANLAFEVLRWQERKGEREAAQANRQAVHFGIAAEEWRIANEAQAAYWDCIGLQAKLGANRAAVEIADLLCNSVKARVERGKDSQFDLNLAEMDRLKLQSESLGTESELASARRKIRELIGLPPEAEVNLQVHGDDPASLVRGWNLEQLTACLPESARLRSVELQYQVAEGELRAATARQFPSLKLGPAGDFVFDGNAWTSVLGSLVAFELPFLHRNGGELLQKRAARDLARAAYTAQLHAARAELAEAVGAARLLEKRVVFEREELLPKANESLQLTQKAFEAGSMDAVALLKAQSSIVDAKIGYCSLLIEHHRTLQSIQRILGRRLNDVAKPAALGPAGPENKPAQPEQR